MKPGRRADLYEVSAETESSDEMRDPPVWLRSPTLGPVLTLCQQVLLLPFLEAEGEALSSQISHRRMIVLSAAAGLLAVGIALVQFVLRAAGIGGGDWAPWQFVAMAPAVAAVGLGLVATLREDLIYRRHRAELIRSLKFRLLIDPGRWIGGTAQLDRAEAWLEHELDKIDKLAHRDIALWARREKGPEGPAFSPGRELPRPLLRDLVRYYTDRRLNVPRERASRRSRTLRPAGWLPDRLGGYLFFFSAVAVTCHLVLERFAAGRADALSLALLTTAALFPAAGATLRTVRLATEVDRSRRRAPTTDVALRGLGSAIKRDQPEEGTLISLWNCEQVLEWDHRAWMRRMTEVRWLG
jgi:hypothetical protein